MPSPELPTLTDDFWLTAHDTVSGKPRLPAGPLGVGLAAGLLAELLFTRNVTVEGGVLHPQFAPQPDDSALAPIVKLLDEEERTLRRQTADLYRQPGLDLREWIQYLAIDNRAADLVTNRLSQRGLVTLEQRRKLFGGSASRFTPRDSFTSGVPAVRIITALQRREVLAQHSLVLAGLLLTTGLHQQALEALTTDERAALASQLRSMNQMLRDLLRCAEQIVGEAVMTR